MNDDRFTLDVEVPVNTTATIVLPAAAITESGQSVAKWPGVVYVGMANGSASYNVGSGRCSFTATLTDSGNP